MISGDNAHDQNKITNSEISDISMNDLWERTFDAIPDLIAIIDNDYRIVKMNRAFREKLNLQDNESCTAPCYELVHDMSHPPHNCPHQLLMKDHKEHESIQTVGQLGGTFIVTTSPLHAHGELIGSVHVARDITERQKAEKLIKQSEARFRALFENMKEAVGIHALIYDDNNQAIDYAARDVNDAYCALTALPREKIIDQRASNIYGTPDAPFLALFQNVAATGKPATFTTYFKPLEKHLSISVFSPQPGLFATVASDLTDLMNAQKAKHQYETNLQEMQRLESLRVLAGGVAHDFNNILQIIVGYASILKERSHSDADKHALNEISRAGERGKSLTNQMLHYSGKALHTAHMTNINELIRENQVLFESMVSARCALSLNFNTETAYVICDPTQIEQIVTNLCINSAESLEEKGGGAIEIAVNVIHLKKKSADLGYKGHNVPPGAYVEIKVTDEGKGIPPELISRIYEPFFSTKFTGRGLGLSSVLGIVETNKGAIRVESQPDKGTSFSIILPTVDEADIIAHGSPHDSNDHEEIALKRPARLKGKTVLAADDESAILLIIKQTLQREGATVITAKDGTEALTLFKKQRDKIDAVVLDYTMPRLSGIKVAGEIRKLAPQTAVLISSGFSEIDFKEIPDAQFLKKPFSAVQLLATLHEAMDKRIRKNK